MRIKGFFFILAFLLLVLGGALLWLAGRMGAAFFYVGEGLVACILIYLLFFYRKIVKPLNTIGNGMELLREQDFSSRLSPVGQYEADRIVNIFNRMMEQLKNERLRLREQNTFLDLLINASPMGVIITSLDEELTELNPMALKMLGVRREEAVGKKMNEIDSPLAAELANVQRGKTVTVRLNDSNIYRCSYSSFIDRGFRHPFYLVETLTDEVMKAEKKAYGKVIRMIAHEVNNTTAGITSTLDTVEQTLSGEAGTEEICDMMRVCADRCFSMSRFITRFADVVKIPEPTLVPTDLNDVVLTCKRFMEGMCNERNIRLHLECNPNLGIVRMDVALFEQALVNIIKNAIESVETMAGASGRQGEIWIRTASPTYIEIADNGIGIGKEVRTKLFSPFFSTKPNGQGIGLLFIREVLGRHGCTFSLCTDDDGLTRFRIWLQEK